MLDVKAGRGRIIRRARRGAATIPSDSVGRRGPLDYEMEISLSTLDWILFTLYLAVVLALGLKFAGEQHSNEDYFVGGRTMNWLPVGLSMFATTFSSLSFVGLPREAAFEDYHLYLAILFIPLFVSPIIWIWFVPLYHRLRVTSPYEYMELRFDRSVRRLCSGLSIVYTIGWMGSMLYAVGVILQAVLDLSPQQLNVTLIGVGLFATLYTSLGGVKAVIWTDVLQAITLGGGMAVVLVMAIARIDGGWDSVWLVGTAAGKFDMFDMRFDLTHRANFFSAAAFGIFVYLPAKAVSLGAVQRFVSLPTIADARRCVVVNALMVSVICLLFFLVGTTLFVFYHQPGAGGFPSLASQDQLLPHFVVTKIPQFGLTGLLVAGLFAAAMSSVDSGINSLTLTIVIDWMSGRHPGVTFSRWLCAGFGLLTIGASLLVPVLGKNVFDIIIKISGALFGPMLGLFLLAMWSKRANSTGAWIGFLAGAGVLAVVWGMTDVSHWWYGAFTCVPTLTAGWVGSIVFSSSVQKAAANSDT